MVSAALRGVQLPSSGRGTAIWKHKDLLAEDEGTEAIVEFAFEGRSSRRDVFEPRNGAKGTRSFAEIMSEKYYMAINPGSAIIDKVNTFRRRIGEDFHPDALMKFRNRPIAEKITTLIHPKVAMSVSVDGEGILYIRAQQNFEKPNAETELAGYPEYQKVELAFDTKNGLLPVSLTSTTKYPDRETQDINRLHWARYDSVLYVMSITRVLKGKHNATRDEYVIASFRPNVQIPDEEFTLRGLTIPDGLPIFDRIAGIEYRYGSLRTTAELEKPLSDANFVQKIREQDGGRAPGSVNTNVLQGPGAPNAVSEMDNTTQDDSSALSPSVITVCVLILIGIAALIAYVFRFRQRQG